MHGAEQDVIFRQVHEPGRLGLSDFTDGLTMPVTTVLLLELMIFPAFRKSRKKAFQEEEG